jgi:chromate transporter
MTDGRAEEEGVLTPCSLAELVRYFLRLGAIGFGGPIALAGYMQRDLVERRRWLSKQDYVEGLALAQLSPGPLAAQLAMYLGWVRAGTVGAAAVGVAFILPSFLMVLVLAALYIRFGGSHWIQGAFYGVGAAVIAIFARSTVKLAKLTLGRDALLWVLFAASAAVTIVTESEIVWLFLAAGVIALFAKARPPRASSSGGAAVIPPLLVAGVHGPEPASVLLQILWFFTKAGAFVFGSGLAIVPFLYSGVVREYGWLTEQQFRDAVAVAMITPGPVVITAGFIGYLTAGPIGALLAGIGTFLPPFLVVVLAARRLRNAGPRLKVFISGVTAAATGAIAGAAFVLGRRALVDVGAGVIALVALVILLAWKKAPEPLLILAAGVAGVLLRHP